MAKWAMPDEGPLMAAAKDWAEGRKPKDAVLELFVRILQLTALTFKLAEEAGLDVSNVKNPAEADQADAEPTKVPPLPVPSGEDFNQRGR